MPVPFKNPPDPVGQGVRAMTGPSVAFVCSRRPEISHQKHPDRRCKACFRCLKCINEGTYFMNGTPFAVSDLPQGVPHFRLKPDTGPAAVDCNIPAD